MPTPNRAMTESFPFGARGDGIAPVKLRFNRTNLQLNLTWENASELTAAQGTLTAKLQDSADGTSYADVSGTSATVVPGGRFGVANVTVREYVQVIASGNVEGLLLLTPDSPAVEITKV